MLCVSGYWKHSRVCKKTYPNPVKLREAFHEAFTLTLGCCCRTGLMRVHLISERCLGCTALVNGLCEEGGSVGLDQIYVHSCMHICSWLYTGEDSPASGTLVRCMSSMAVGCNRGQSLSSCHRLLQRVSLQTAVKLQGFPSAHSILEQESPSFFRVWPVLGSLG